MGTVTVKQLEERRKSAQMERDSFQPLLDEVYKYVVPYRKGISRTGAGEKRINQIFDNTAMIAAFRGAGRIAQDISPPGQQSFELTPGALAKIVLPRRELEELERQIEPTKAVINAHFQTGEWDQSLQEMALDLEASTGCMLIVPDKRRRISRFVSVPLEEVMLTKGPYNEVNGIFWTRKWSLRAIVEEFGDGKFTEELAKTLKEKPEHEICLYQDTIYEPDEDRWCRVAWAKENQGKNSQPVAFERSYSKTCPWLTPRYFVVPGEVYGRGTAMLVMPTVNALNTATKLNLQGAAIAMLGIYTAIDDGVFSPDNAPITPGAFWKVARNGGALGPSVQRFPDPRIDLSQIILKELRMDVQAGMNDQSLPPDSAAVRSATEIMERMKRLATDHMGAFGRLIMEIAVPAVKRVMEIAYEFQQIPNNIPIDRLLIDLQVSSPMAMAREAERLQRIMQYVEMAMMLSPNMPGRYVKLDEVMPDVARALAIPSKYIPTQDEREAMDEQAATAQALAAGAAMAAEDPDAVEELAQAA
ncbi:MAG: hypothetical protein RJB58_40 [Pseudomonadota bacterium]|jgi:hypothetical protein